MTFFNSRISNIKTIRSTPNTQLSSNNWQLLSGSRVTYVPSDKASEVVYQYSYGWHRSNSQSNLMHIKFVSGSNENEINSSPSDIINSNFNIGATNVFSRGSSIIKKIIPAWQGEKVIQLNFRHYSNSFSVETHDIDYWSGSSTSNPINCNLIIYSVE